MPTILIADDERLHCRAMRLLLEHEGFTVLEAADGETAMLLATKHSPDLVILDSLLPSFPGIDCIGEIRKAVGKTVAVVVCSARHEVDYVLECTDAGADAFIHKPFNAHTFLHKIHRLVCSQHVMTPEQN